VEQCLPQEDATRERADGALIVDTINTVACLNGLFCSALGRRAEGGAVSSEGVTGGGLMVSKVLFLTLL
jgi:hypothetical protein